jgi:hypothetical protein
MHQCRANLPARQGQIAGTNGVYQERRCWVFLAVVNPVVRRSVNNHIWPLALQKGFHRGPVFHAQLGVINWDQFAASRSSAKVGPELAAGTYNNNFHKSFLGI